MTLSCLRAEAYDIACPLYRTGQFDQTVDLELSIANRSRPIENSQIELFQLPHIILDAVLLAFFEGFLGKPAGEILILQQVDDFFRQGGWIGGWNQKGMHSVLCHFADTADACRHNRIACAAIASTRASGNPSVSDGNCCFLSKRPIGGILVRLDVQDGVFMHDRRKAQSGRGYAAEIS